MNEMSSLTNTSTAYGILNTVKNLAPLIGIYSLAPLLADLSPVLAWALTPIIGALIYRLTMVMHDCGHGTLFSSRWANVWIGKCLGYLSGIDFDRFRERHAEHHRRYGVAGDPQGFHYLGISRLRRPAFAWHLIKPLFGLNLKYVFAESALAPGNLIKGLKSGEIIGLFATQLAVMFLITGAGRHLSLVLMPFIGAVTVGLFLSQLRGIAEHGLRDEGEAEGFVRSHTTDWLGRLLLYDVNFNFHEEHHRYPGIPSHNLPLLFDTMRQAGAFDRRTMWYTLTSMMKRS